jgi:hypothetical protein
MARTSDPHSATAQFFINTTDNSFLDNDRAQDGWGYAVFGRVVEGMDVVDRISVSPTGAMGPFKQDAPMQAVVIQKIELLADAPAPAPASAPAPAPAATTPPATETPPAESPAGETAPADSNAGADTPKP